MKSVAELNAYFERIGYDGPAEASVEVLKELHRLHPRVIAFENLNSLLGMSIKLDLESLQEKMIHQNRGGYCFEHNLLFKSVLETLGFTVRGLAARILWNVPEDQTTPRGHMLLLVESERDNYIADVGFGGLTLTAPLRLEPDTVQETPHEPFRLRQAGDEYIMKAKIRDEWKSLYRFSLQEQFLPDYEVSSWYLSNHPSSHFVTDLIAARSTPETRYVLKNNKFAIHHLEAGTKKRTLSTIEEIKMILEEKFLLSLPAASELNKKMRQLVGSEERVVV